MNCDDLITEYEKARLLEIVGKIIIISNELVHFSSLCSQFLVTGAKKLDRGKIQYDVAVTDGAPENRASRDIVKYAPKIVLEYLESILRWKTSASSDHAGIDVKPTIETVNPTGQPESVICEFFF